MYGGGTRTRRRTWIYVRQTAAAGTGRNASDAFFLLRVNPRSRACAARFVRRAAFASTTTSCVTTRSGIWVSKGARAMTARIRCPVESSLEKFHRYSVAVPRGEVFRILVWLKCLRNTRNAKRTPIRMLMTFYHNPTPLACPIFRLFTK